MADSIKLGYWGIRGQGHVARLLLAYSGLKWDNVAYTDHNQWFGVDKINLGFDFPNLPYLIDGDFKISESSAIHRYIANKSGKTDLLGKNIHDIAKVDEVLGALGDARTNIGKLIFDKDYEPKLKETWEKVKPKFDYFEKFVGDKQWTLGYLTVADFFVAEFSHYFENIYPQEYKAYPSIQRIRTNFENLAQIKAYYAEPTAIKGPFVPAHVAAIKF